ncbi:MAG: YihY family inner membrane protein [Campylobacterota bacterium]|nr:YihY family inner membrane protein [Campylobacterota bacterium]
MQKKRLLKLYVYLKFFISTFMDKELTLFAASLSFYTIFSFIPLLLITMTILTSLESFADVYVMIQDFIFANLLPMNSEVLMQYLNEFLQNSVEMSSLSFIMLFVSSLLFFKNYEFIANRAFHAPQRNFLESVGVYFLMLIITPVSLGIAFYITGYVAALIASNPMTSDVDILPLVPYTIIWVLFFILFKLSANIKVHFMAAAISSFIISVVFSMAKNSFIYYVFLNKSYSTIYGSFAVLLYLFLWIYLSWVIFIYGLKLCYLINRVYQDRKIKHQQYKDKISVKNTQE